MKITWIDAKMWGNAWLEHEDIRALKPPIVRSYGEIISEDDVVIRLAQNITNDCASNITLIPKASIIKEVNNE